MHAINVTIHVVRVTMLKINLMQYTLYLAIQTVYVSIYSACNPTPYLHIIKQITQTQHLLQHVIHAYVLQSEYRTMAAFVLSMIVHDYPLGQEAVYKGKAIHICLLLLDYKQDHRLRAWCALCLGQVQYLCGLFYYTLIPLRLGSMLRFTSHII